MVEAGYGQCWQVQCKAQGKDSSASTHAGHMKPTIQKVQCSRKKSNWGQEDPESGPLPLPFSPWSSKSQSFHGPGYECWPPCWYSPGSLAFSHAWECLFFRALAILHKADSTSRSAGPVPGPMSPLTCPMSSTYLPAWHRETCQSQSSRDREGNGPDRWGYPSGPDGGAPGDGL